MKIGMKILLAAVAATAALLNLGALELQSARFGADTRWADVTEAFRKFRVNDDFYAGWIDGNRMAGKDPAPGVAKILEVQYKDNDGAVKTARLAERTFDGIVADAVVSDEFTLNKVYFGDQGKYVDVTDKMRDVVKSNQPVKLDFSTLGLSGNQDPLPGKQKQVLFFYSVDNRPFCKVFREKDEFKGSMIAPLFDPIPYAADVKSPFAGMELDRPVWQWAVDMRIVNKENNQPSRAWLYIPEKTEKVRGLVIGQFNMLELPILEHPKFREYLRKLDYGCVWIAPSPYGSRFDFTDPKQAEAMEWLFKDLAKASGHAELADVPFVGLGHSAMAAFPWELALWKPERAVCGISYDGGTPGVEYNYNFHDELMTAERLKRLAGIPLLIRDGEYSGGRANRRPLVLNEHVPNLLVTLIADPGSGHFDINDRIVDYLGRYLEKADKARNFGPGKLKKVDYASGWNVDYWRVNNPPAAAPAPVGEFKGITGKYGEEKMWVFDEEFARFHEKYLEYQRGNKVELLGYVQDGKVLPDRKDHPQIHPRFAPEKDGLSFRLDGTFLDKVTEGRAAGWSGLPAGSPIAHGGDPERIEFTPICGPVVATGHGTLAVRFYRFGFTSSRRTGEIYMKAVYPGDDVYRRSVLQSVMMVPRSNDKGIAQKIDFPPIPDQKEGVKSLKLNARANTGMPVEYYVEYGPAWLKDGELVFTPVPPGSKYPVEVSVVAWQYGVKDQIRSAVPVTRKFRIVK